MKPVVADRSRLFDLLMEYVADAILVIDRHLLVIEASREASALLGYPIAELIGASFANMLDAKSRERTLENFRSANERRLGGATLVTKLGKRVLVSYSACPLIDSSGRAGYLLMVARRDAGSRSPRRADPTNGLAERLLVGFADPVFIVDGASRTIRDCNATASTALGFSRDELLGSRLLDHVSAMGAPRGTHVLKARADHVYATAGVFQERVQFPRKSAPPMPCELIGLPFFEPDGSLELIVVMLLDRSAEYDREADLVSMASKVRDFAVELGELAASSPVRGGTKRLSELGFSPRQVEIARLCSLGYSSKEIGGELGIAETTVKNHISVLYRKLEVHSRIGLARALSTRRIRFE